MHETGINWAQRVEAVAQAAIRAHEVIKVKRSEHIDPEALIRYGSPEYFKAVNELVASASHRIKF